jgi:CubicO group peptidase (beta-lactamase class C family)
MRLPTPVRICAGLLALGACGLAAQQPPEPDPDGGFADVVSAPVLRAGALLSVDAAATGPDDVSSALVPSVERLMKSAVARGVAPGAAVVIGHAGRIVLAKGWGRIDLAPRAAAVTDETLWDLASVTKVAATTVGAMLLVQDGTLDLGAPVARYLPEWPAVGDRGRITVRDLLRHTSGLPAGSPVARRGSSGLIARLAALPLHAAPGEEEHYGDLDMVLLGQVIERVSGEPLDRLLERRVYRRLGMTETTYRPLDAGFALDRIAATERVRGTLIHGVVHDPIARGLGGVSGNAGLFASARDLGVLASALLWESPARVVCRDIVRQFTRPTGGDYALGWENAAPGTSWGDIFDRAAYGHVGYTGTSLWIDPTHDLFVVLLTNRVDPSARNRKHLALRRELHETVERAVARAAHPAPPADGCSDERAQKERAVQLRVRDAELKLPPVVFVW